MGFAKSRDKKKYKKEKKKKKKRERKNSREALWCIRILDFESKLKITVRFLNAKLMYVHCWGEKSLNSTTGWKFVYLLWIPRPDFCLQAEVSLKEWSLRTAVPKLRDLMPADLRRSRCSSSRHKVHNVLDHSETSPPSLPCPWKNCLPWIRSPVAKRLRTAGLESQGFTGTVHAQLLQSCLTLRDPMDCSPPGSSVHGDSPGKNTGVGWYALLQGILLTKGLNLHLLCLLHWQVGSLPLVPPRKLLMGTKIEPQEETKLRRFKDYGLSGATGGLGGPSKGSCQQGPEEAVDTAGRAWLETLGSNVTQQKRWEECGPGQRGKGVGNEEPDPGDACRVFKPFKDG